MNEMSIPNKSKFKDSVSSERKTTSNNKANKVNQKLKEMQISANVKFKIPDETEEFSSRFDTRRREKLSENNINLMINQHKEDIMNSEAIRLNTLTKSPPPNKFESTVSSDPQQEVQNRQSIGENSMTTKGNMIKSILYCCNVLVKHKVKKRSRAAISPLVEKQSVISISNMSSYDIPKKFMSKYQTIKQQNENAVNLDEGYKEMESILGNKNISYGYGDSK